MIAYVIFAKFDKNVGFRLYSGVYIIQNINQGSSTFSCIFTIINLTIHNYFYIHRLSYTVMRLYNWSTSLIEWIKQFIMRQKLATLSYSSLILPPLAWQLRVRTAERQWCPLLPVILRIRITLARTSFNYNHL